MEIDTISKCEAADLVTLIYLWAKTLVQEAAGGPNESTSY